MSNQVNVLELRRLGVFDYLNVGLDNGFAKDEAQRFDSTNMRRHAELLPLDFTGGLH